MATYALYGWPGFVTPPPLVRPADAYYQPRPRRGTGMLSSSFPSALTTVEGTPVSAQVLVRYRADTPGDYADGVLVAQTVSSASGEWVVEGLDPALRYDVSARYAGENDALQADVRPFDEPRFSGAVQVPVGVPLDVALPIIGGRGSVTATYVSGTYPSGVSLVGNRLQGAWPTGATGIYPITFDLTDDEGTYTRVLNIDLYLLPMTLSGSVPVLVVGDPVNVTFMASGGEGPYTYAVTAGSLPPGLSLNGSTGEISGTPTTPGAYSFDITVTDVRSTAVSKGFSGEVYVRFATYSEYRSHVIGLSVDASHTPASVSAMGLPSAAATTRYVVADARAPTSGSMWGSPAASNQAVTSDSSMARVIQHAIESLSSLPPSAAENVFLVTTGAAISASSFTSVSKNGYTSASYGGSFTARVFETFVYWDYGLSRARVYDATTGTYSDYYG
jgi:hypothetical protein